ncbi:MAG: hypothetical protein KGK02_01570 [Rhodospirillales bacterium]|nr:hypothetical protein [Rhodospirillales bacterium]
MIEHLGLNYLRRAMAKLPGKVKEQTAPSWPVDPQPKQKRAVVISNCQCFPLAAWLTVLSADKVFDFWGVHVIDPTQRENAIKAFVDKAKIEYDLILSIPLSEDFLGLSSEHIADTFSGIPVILVSNIYFAGFHPDQTYIGGLNQRVAGPLGDAHSKLAIHGFMTGQTVDQTLRLFCSETYEKLGYFNEFVLSFNELTKRDAIVDVPVTRYLKETLKTNLCFYSFNHPTSLVFSVYAAGIIQHLASLGLVQPSNLPADESLCAENLAANIIFPVYPEIAAYHRVPHIGSYAFKPVGPWVNPIDLRRFLTLEFEAFENVGRETLALSHAAQNIAHQFTVLSA